MSTLSRSLINAVIKYIAGVIIFAALLFIPAGTFHFPEAWQVMFLLFVPMFAMGIALSIYSPNLLAERLDAKEKSKKQQGIIKFSGLIFLAGFIVAGLDKRYNWSEIPFTLRATCSILFLLSYAMYAEVMRENAWLSRSIKVVEGQKVVSSGLYGIVRHPMYSATLLMFTSMPIILGSWYSLAIFLFYIPAIVARIIEEEHLLTKELTGYSDYCKEHRWRLIPFIW